MASAVMACIRYSNRASDPDRSFDPESRWSLDGGSRGSSVFINKLRLGCREAWERLAFISNGLGS